MLQFIDHCYKLPNGDPCQSESEYMQRRFYMACGTIFTICLRTFSLFWLTRTPISVSFLETSSCFAESYLLLFLFPYYLHSATLKWREKRSNKLDTSLGYKFNENCKNSNFLNSMNIVAWLKLWFKILSQVLRTKSR